MIWCDVMWCDVMWYSDVIWYDVMWCDVMLYDMIWYDMIWYDTIWYDMIWYNMMWCDMMWYDVMWCDVMWCDSIWYDMMWYNMIWYDKIRWDLFFYRKLQQSVDLRIRTSFITFTLVIRLISLFLEIQLALPCIAGCMDGWIACRQPTQSPRLQKRWYRYWIIGRQFTALNAFLFRIA